MNLFPEDTDTVTAPERPSPRVVRLLEPFGYRAEAVRLWTPEHAETVLRACQREQRIALARADRAARQAEGTAKRGQPGRVERLQAAEYLTQCLSGDVDDLQQAVLYSGHAMTDAEVRELAGWLLAKFKEQS